MTVSNSPLVPSMVGKLVQVTVVDTTKDDALVIRVVGYLNSYAEWGDGRWIFRLMDDGGESQTNSWHRLDAEVIYQ
jgi:hypothetical protein